MSNVMIDSGNLGAFQFHEPSVFDKSIYHELAVGLFRLKIRTTNGVSTVGKSWSATPVGIE